MNIYVKKKIKELFLFKDDILKYYHFFCSHYVRITPVLYNMLAENINYWIKYHNQ